MSARTAAAVREHLATIGTVPKEIPIGELWAFDFFGQLAFARADKFARISLELIELSSDQLLTFTIEKSAGSSAITGLLAFHEQAGERRTLVYRVLGTDPDKPNDVIAERLFDRT